MHKKKIMYIMLYKACLNLLSVVLQWWKIVLSEKRSLKIFDKKYLCSIIIETIYTR